MTLGAPAAVRAEPHRPAAGRAGLRLHPGRVQAAGRRRAIPGARRGHGSGRRRQHDRRTALQPGLSAAADPRPCSASATSSRSCRGRSWPPKGPPSRATIDRSARCSTTRVIRRLNAAVDVYGPGPGRGGQAVPPGPRPGPARRARLSRSVRAPLAAARAEAAGAALGPASSSTSCTAGVSIRDQHELGDPVARRERERGSRGRCSAAAPGSRRGSRRRSGPGR